MKPTDPIASAMQAAVKAGVFPGAVLLVRARGRIAYERAFGFASLLPREEAASLETVYDLASLTKPLATASAILCLVQDSRLGLDDPLDELLAELKGSAVGRATVSHLLNHSSGLPGWRPFYERIAEQDRVRPGFLGSVAAKELVLALIRDEDLVFPVGTRSLYSDLGFMLLGLVVERHAGCPLDRFIHERVYRAINAEPLLFIQHAPSPHPFPPGVPVTFLHATGQGGEEKVRGDIASTEEDAWRGRMLRGEVHDENAYAMGGVAGHSGLFGTASAVLAVSGAWLASYLGRDALLSPDLVRRFVTRQDRTPISSWGLGWDTPSDPSSSGTHFSPRSFGHLGYTGTSLWIDPEREVEVVLLSNRVHPTRRNEEIRKFRPFIHDVIYEELLH